MTEDYYKYLLHEGRASNERIIQKLREGEI